MISQVHKTTPGKGAERFQPKLRSLLIVLLLTSALLASVARFGATGVLLFFFPLLVATSAAAWVSLGIRWRNGERILPAVPRAAVPWGLVDLGIAILVCFLCQSVALHAAATLFGVESLAKLQEHSPIQQIGVLVGGASGVFASALVSALLIKIRTGASLADYGIDFASAIGDIKLGAVTFVMLAPIVYSVQYVMINFCRLQYDQSFIELVTREPSWQLIAMTSFATIMLAPVQEEFQFRVLLQGWFEKAADSGGDTRALLLGSRPDWGSVTGCGKDAGGEWSGAELRPESGTDEATAGGARLASLQPAPVPSHWPIVSSAALFALAHVGQGPGPLPALFVLALGIGFLYQRTHRILPGIVVHLLLNATTLGQLIVFVLGQSPNAGN